LSTAVSFSGILLLLGVLTGVLTPLLTAQPKAGTAPSDEPVVDLPPLMVESTTTPLRWRYLELPGLEVLSVCDDSTTREFLRRYFRQSNLLAWLIPEKYQGRSSVPDSYILFNEEIHRANSTEIVADMIRRDGGRKGSGDAGRDKSSSREQWGREPPRIRFLPNMRMVDLDSTSVFVILREADPGSLNFSFTLDRVGQLLQQRVPALPPWLIVGLAGLYAESNLRDEVIRIESARWLSPEEANALSRDESRPRALVPMEDLFIWKPGRKSAEIGEMERIRRAQCTLFVRWAAVADQGARRDALWSMVDRLEKEPMSEVLFEEHFGMGFSDMRDVLSDYLSTATSEEMVMKDAKPGRPPSFQLRAATPAEVARLRGDWERMEIAFVRKRFPELVPKYIEQARRTLLRAYDKGERDPRLLAVLGLLECDADNRLAGEPLLEEATRAGVVRPRAYFELALIRYATSQAAAPNDENASLTADQVERIISPLWTAHGQWPPLPMVYTLMAEAWSKGQTPLTREQLDVLTRAVKLFPHVSPLALRTAYLQAANGFTAEAGNTLAFGLDSTDDPKMRDRFERARMQLERAVDKIE